MQLQLLVKHVGMSVYVCTPECFIYLFLFYNITTLLSTQLKYILTFFKSNIILLGLFPNLF